jgi:hypothetical protein
LQRSIQASTVVDLAFNPAPPALIETGKSWTYSLVVTNNSVKEITVDGALETRTVTGQPSPPQKSISGQVTIPVGHPAPFPVHHDPHDTPAGSLTIEVRVFGKIGNSAWWRSTAAGSITVVQSPSIDLSGFPDSVPPGTSWKQSFVIRNDASIALTLDSVTIAENNGAPQPLSGTPFAVRAGGSHTFDSVAHDGIEADLTVIIFAKFTWTGGVVSSIQNHKKVQVRRDLEGSVKVLVPPEVDKDWSFDLTLNNKSSEQVTLRALHHRITSSDFAHNPAQQEISSAAGVTIDPGDHITFPGVQGIHVPSATQKIRLEIDVEYDRGSLRLHPDPVTKDIDVAPPPPPT